MPYCKNDNSKSYKGTEPSPKGIGYCAHAEKIGSKKKGKDGNIWIVKQVSNGSKRWIKKSTSKKSTSKKESLDDLLDNYIEIYSRLPKKRDISLNTIFKYKNKFYIKNFKVLNVFRWEEISKSEVEQWLREEREKKIKKLNKVPTESKYIINNKYREFDIIKVGKKYYIYRDSGINSHEYYFDDITKIITFDLDTKYKVKYSVVNSIPDDSNNDTVSTPRIIQYQGVYYTNKQNVYHEYIKLPNDFDPNDAGPIISPNIGKGFCIKGKDGLNWISIRNKNKLTWIHEKLMSETLTPYEYYSQYQDYSPKISIKNMNSKLNKLKSKLLKHNIYFNIIQWNRVWNFSDYADYDMTEWLQYKLKITEDEVFNESYIYISQFTLFNSIFEKYPLYFQHNIQKDKVKIVNAIFKKIFGNKYSWPNNSNNQTIKVKV